MKRVLEPMPCVSQVMINVPLSVTVEHDPSVIGSDDLVDALNNSHFDASLRPESVTDGDASTTAMTAVACTRGKSRFRVENIYCASEIHEVNSIVQNLSGVYGTSINIVNRIVRVDHDFDVTAAREICDTLNFRGDFGASVDLDAAVAAATNCSLSSSSFLRSRLTLDRDILVPSCGGSGGEVVEGGGIGANNNNENAADADNLSTFLQSFHLAETKSFLVDIPAKTISVVHNPFLLSVQEIADSLYEQTDIRAAVAEDGVDP